MQNEKQNVSTERVFITGCNGFLGQALSERLLQEGYDVYGLMLEGKAKVEGVKAIKGDLLNVNRIQKVLREVQPNYIIHLAARTEVEKSFYDPIEFSSINYIGTVNLIEKAKSLNMLKLFLFASTMETYGAVYTKEECEEGDNLKPFNEETKQFPNAPYAVAKIGCEYYLKYAGRAYDFPWTALRQTNTYGRKDNDFFVVEQIITQMLKNDKEIKLGYKDPYRNFLYVEDLIDLYVEMIKKPEKVQGEIFCCGPDNALRMEDLAKKIAKKMSWSGTILWDKKPKRVGEIYYLSSVGDKIEKAIGWKPKVSLEEGLDRTITYWQEKLTKK